MFEKFTKKFANKATDGAVEGVKEALNDKIDRYGDIIQLGLVVAVIAFGGKHLTKKHNPTPTYSYPPQPYRIPGYTGQPIIVNNYYHDPTKEGLYYGNQTRKNHQKR